MELQTFTKFDFPHTHYSTTTIAVAEDKRHESVSLDRAQLNCSGLKIEFAERDGRVRVTAATEDKTLHPHLDSRISEAMLFALGHTIDWSVIVRREARVETTCLRSPQPRPGRQSSLTPIAFNTIDQTGQVWQVFARYLDFVLKECGRSFHPLSAQLLGVVRSLDGSVEARALTAAVAVESILSQFYESAGQQDEATQKSIDELIAMVQLWPGNATMRDRAVGSLRQLKSVRPGDRLRELLNRNVVAERDVKAWRKIRNSATHGDWSGVKNLQAFIDQTGQVHVLLYQLILHLIGFEGKQTDWGTHGWPLIDYPPNTAATRVG